MIQAGKNAVPKRSAQAGQGPIDLRKVDLKTIHEAIALQERRETEARCGALKPIGVPEGSGRYPQVHEEQNAQEKLICLAEEALELLASKLQPIIPPQPPTGQTDKDGPEPCLCQVAERLNRTNRRLQKLTDALNVLCSIVEV